MNKLFVAIQERIQRFLREEVEKTIIRVAPYGIKINCTFTNIMILLKLDQFYVEKQKVCISFLSTVGFGSEGVNDGGVVVVVMVMMVVVVVVVRSGASKQSRLETLTVIMMVTLTG